MKRLFARAEGARPRNSPAIWDWSFGLLAVAVAFVGVYAVVILAGLMIGASDVARLTDQYPQATGITQDLLWIGVAVLLPLTAYGFLRPADLGLGRVSGARTITVTVLGLLIFYALAAAYGLVAGLNGDSNQRLTELGLGSSISSDLGYVALYGVLAPVAEELLFRGLLFGSLRARFGPWPAALASGAVFGLVHLGGGQDVFIPVLATLGVVLALAYHYSGALYAAIAIHAVNNVVSTGASHQPATDWIYAALAAAPFAAVATAYILGSAIAAWAPAAPKRASRSKAAH